MSFNTQEIYKLYSNSLVTNDPSYQQRINELLQQRYQSTTASEIRLREQAARNSVQPYFVPRHKPKPINLLLLLEDV